MSPKDFDNLFQTAQDKGVWEYQTLVVSYAPRFHEGRRSEEAIDLTTQDFIPDNGFPDIHTPGTKTDAAPPWFRFATWSISSP